MEIDPHSVSLSSRRAPSAAGRDGRLDGRATGGTTCLRIRCPSGERTTRSRLATSRSPARMHRSTWIDIAASLMRQDHSWPLLPDQTRKASPLRSSRIRHLRMDIVSFMLASPSWAYVRHHCRSAAVSLSRPKQGRFKATRACEGRATRVPGGARAATSDYHRRGHHRARIGAGASVEQAIQVAAGRQTSQDPLRCRITAR
jgi:hypothetical protein